jgi:N-acetylglutamate synthase-like GNAT family acetyltransferase
VARKGVLIDASVLPGFVASDGGRLVGLLAYDVASGECEVVAIISTEEGRGIGWGLMDAARDYAEAAGYRRLWLITTNDNTRAIRFCQRWGWTCVPSTATACDARGRSSLRSLTEGSTVFRLSTSSSSRCSLVVQFALRSLYGKAGNRGRRTGLTPDERTISAYATACSSSIACSYSDEAQPSPSAAAPRSLQPNASAES